ncbi:hypothetical protein [Ruminococcus sp. NK3A76]|uniref:hypothetical protein n=1 Tax=Ruminococcus sp. NK3A76 TaxID=877411 RepID=UPI00048DC971|nr:hypothetical protein [Ruminococcus sp. NK3A76]
MKTRSRKTRLLSFVLSLLMVLTLMPDISVRVYAAGNTYNVGDEVTDYLTFTAVDGAATVKIKVASGSLQYDSGSGFTDYTSDTAINLSNGSSVKFKGTDVTFDNNHHVSIPEGKVACSGDVCSLRLDDAGKFSGLENSCFAYMFNNCDGLTTAPELPATTLADYCYIFMFSYCDGLTTAPALPATELADGCYNSMFYNCTGLTTAPELPATKLASGCYLYMFSRCTGLTTAPELPATTLANSCYYSMFNGCTGLTEAPELPATTLASECYENMFFGCTGLTTAPALPATTLANYCYRNMFSGCTGIRLSETKNDEYKYTYTIGQTSAFDALTNMFENTGGTFKGTPDVGKTYYMDSSIHKFNAASTAYDQNKLQYDFPGTTGKNIKKIEVLMDIESFAQDGWGQVVYQNGEGDDHKKYTPFNINKPGIKKYTAEGQLDGITFAGVKLIGKGTLLAYTITFADNTTVSAGSWSYPTYTAPAAVTGLSYTGTAQELVTAGTVTGGTIKYLKVISLGNYTVLSIENMNVNDIYQPADNKGIIFPKDYKLTIAETTYLPLTDNAWNLDNQIKLFLKYGKCWISSRSEDNFAQSVYLSENIDALRITAIDTVNKTITAEAVNTSQLWSDALNTSQLWSETVPTGTDVGTYTVYYRIDANAGYQGVAATKIADVKIGKADSLVAAPTAKTGLKYTGSAQALVNAGTATGGTMYYSLTFDPTVHKADGETLTVNIADLKAGDVLQVTRNNASRIEFTGGTVKYRDSQGEVEPYEFDYMVYAYLESIQPYHHIELREIGGGGMSFNNETYNAMIVASNDGSTVMLEAYNYIDGEKTTVWYDSVPTGTDAGTYSVCYKVVGDDNHNDIAPTLIGNVEIGKASAVKTAPTAKDPVRENSPVQLINAGEAQTGCTIEYQLGTSATAVPTGEWTTDAATITANSSGTYYVWYKATGDGKNYTDSAPKCVTVKVTQAQLWTIEMPDYVYDCTAHEPTIKGMTFGKLTYTYFTSAGICIGTTAPTEPGDYRVSVAASGDETHPSKLESVEYTIKSAKFAAGNTVSFKEKVEFNFLVEATDAETVEGAYVVFTYDHYGEKMTVKKPINKDDKNGKYYRVRLPLTASEMAIDIKAELYLPTLDKPVDTKTRSIKDYAEAAIKSNLDGAEVLKAMLNYGGYTQTALNNNTTLLANSGEGIAVDVSAVAPKSATPFLRPVSAQGAKVTYKGSTAMTVSDVYVRHYFTVDSSMTAKELSAVKIQVGDKVLALKDLPKNNTGYYYDVAPQLAYELDKENDKIVVYGFAGAETADSENAISIENYNVIDYCEAVAGSSKQTDASKNMAKALYSYYKAAKAYVDSRA